MVSGARATQEQHRAIRRSQRNTGSLGVALKSIRMRRGSLALGARASGVHFAVIAPLETGPFFVNWHGG
jgi:hypothetical protein